MYSWRHRRREASADRESSLFYSILVLHTPLERIVASLEDLGVSSGMARRICGFPALESDALKRRRDGATEDGPASSSKVARATPANEVQSETDAESDGA